MLYDRREEELYVKKFLIVVFKVIIKEFLRLIDLNQLSWPGKCIKVQERQEKGIYRIQIICRRIFIHKVQQLIITIFPYIQISQFEKIRVKKDGKLGIFFWGGVAFFFYPFFNKCSFLFIYIIVHLQIIRNLYIFYIEPLFSFNK